MMDTGEVFLWIWGLIGFSIWFYMVISDPPSNKNHGWYANNWPNAISRILFYCLLLGPLLPLINYFAVARQRRRRREIVKRSSS